MRPVKAKQYRTIGVVLIAAAIIGWIFSLSGIVIVWVERPRVTAIIEGQVLFFKGALEVTTRGLTITENSLGAIVSSLDVLENIVQSTADTVDLTGPILDSLVKIAEENLPNTVGSVQDSLSTAQQGAGVIDSALKTITSIPLLRNLIGGSSYNPPTPLGDALDAVSGKLDDLTASLNGMADGIQNTRANIQEIQTGIESMASNIGEINTSLQEAQSVINEYQQTIQGLLDFLQKWEGRIPLLLTIVAVILTIFFIWIGATQLGFFMQGLDYIQGTESSTRPD